MRGAIGGKQRGIGCRGIAKIKPVLITEIDTRHGCVTRQFDHVRTIATRVDLVPTGRTDFTNRISSRRQIVQRIATSGIRNVSGLTQVNPTITVEIGVDPNTCECLLAVIPHAIAIVVLPFRTRDSALGFLRGRFRRNDRF